MKKSKLFLFIALIFAFKLSAQSDKEKVFKDRCNELVRVLSLTDREAYRKFIKENYTEALINKPMKRQVIGGPEGQPAEDKASNPLEEKVGLFGMLHRDIGNGKVKDIKIDGDKAEVLVKGSGPTLNITLRFQPSAPHLIDGFGVQMTAGE